MKTNRLNNRCTAQDWRILFASSTDQLHWLCYTLTGDEGLSNKAVDAALDQSLKDANHVFREWMLSWARRVIIKFCITAVRPGDSVVSQPVCPTEPVKFDADHELLAAVLNLPSAALQKKLLQSDPLSRFVFVLRGLEGYSRRDTALLLNIDDRTCESVYLQAAETLGSNLVRQEGSGFNAVLEYA